MATKPTSVPEWNSGGANRVEPTGAKKILGWVLNEIPPSSYYNWYQHLAYTWLAWVNEKLSDITEELAGELGVGIEGTTSQGILEFRTGAADADGTTVGMVQFVDKNSVSANQRVARIRAKLDGATANNRGGELEFFLKPDGADAQHRLADFTMNGASFETSAGTGFTRALKATTSHANTALLAESTGSGYALDVDGGSGTAMRVVATTASNGAEFSQTGAGTAVVIFASNVNQALEVIGGTGATAMSVYGNVGGPTKPTMYAENSDASGVAIEASSLNATGTGFRATTGLLCADLSTGSASGRGLRATVSDATGVAIEAVASAAGGKAITATSTTGTCVTVNSTTGNGILSISSGGVGGIVNTLANGFNALEANATTGNALNGVVTGGASGAGVRGATSGASSYGVSGEASSASSYGVNAYNSSAGTALSALSISGIGVDVLGGTIGVRGSVTGTDTTGVYGRNLGTGGNGGYGVIAEADAVTNPPRRAAFRLVPQLNPPSSPQEGDMVYDASDDKFKGYSNGAWRNFH